MKPSLRIIKLKLEINTLDALSCRRCRFHKTEYREVGSDVHPRQEQCGEHCVLFGKLETYPRRPQRCLDVDVTNELESNSELAYSHGFNEGLAVL